MNGDMEGVRFEPVLGITGDDRYCEFPCFHQGTTECAPVIHLSSEISAAFSLTLHLPAFDIQPYGKPSSLTETFFISLSGQIWKRLQPCPPPAWHPALYRLAQALPPGQKTKLSTLLVFIRTRHNDDIYIVQYGSDSAQTVRVPFLRKLFHFG